MTKKSEPRDDQGGSGLTKAEMKRLAREKLSSLRSSPQWVEPEPGDLAVGAVTLMYPGRPPQEEPVPARPIYYLKDGDVLYRRKDGKDRFLPDEVLGRSGWRPLIGSLTISADAYPKPSQRGGVGNDPDPSLWIRLSLITEKEAKEIATKRNLPTEGW